jgi:hypothetical protein
MVGGVAGFQRLETRLVTAGNRVVTIDPYQLAIDSASVSFDAIARMVDAELEARGITGHFPHEEAPDEVVRRVTRPLITLATILP